MMLELNNCYYVPAISRNIISASCLMAEGYKFIIENNGCSIFLNEIFYGYAPVLKGVLVIFPSRQDSHVSNDSKSNEFRIPSSWSFFIRFSLM